MKNKYTLLNYHGFISLPSEDEKRQIVLDSGELNTLKPFKKSLTIEQIEYVNLRCDVFKTGRIEFSKQDEKEIFDHLDIIVDEDLVRAEQILDTIKNPTKEKLEKVVKIKDLNTIDLFRGIVTSFKNLGDYDLSNRVLNVINKRRDEIYKSPATPTKIVVKKTSNEIASEKTDNIVQNAVEDIVAKYEQRLKDMEKKLEQATKPKVKKPKAVKTEEKKEE